MPSRDRILGDIIHRVDNQIATIVNDAADLVDTPEEHLCIAFGITASVLCHFANAIGYAVPAFTRLTQAQRLYLIGLITAKAESEDIQHTLHDPRIKGLFADTIVALNDIIKRVNER